MASSASRYKELRCKFIDKQGQEFIQKTKQLISKVKDTLTNQDLSRQTCDEAVHQAVTFFSQQFPTIGDEEQPKDDDNENSSSNSDLREEISDLKRDVSELKRTLEQEREKTKKPAAKQQKMQSGGVPLVTIDDEKVFQAAPKPFKFPAPAETHLDVGLQPNKGYSIKKPGETDAIQGMLISSSLLTVIKTGNDNKSRIMQYNFHGTKISSLETLSGMWAIKPLHDKTFTIFNGSYVGKWTLVSSSQPLKFSTLFRREQGDILGVADLKSNSAAITVATRNRILLVEDETVYAEFSIPEPPKDVFSIDQETLMVFDASGFLKINVHTKMSVRIGEGLSINAYYNNIAFHSLTSLS